MEKGFPLFHFVLASSRSMLMSPTILLSRHDDNKYFTFRFVTATHGKQQIHIQFQALLYLVTRF